MKIRILIIASVIVLIVTAFLLFNVIQSSPCDAIFEQTASQLDSKLKFIKAEGELSIGKEKIQDLTETAQLTALNLKTCCIVLDSGKLNSDQFLDCKDTAKSYYSKIETVIRQLKDVAAAKETGNKGTIGEKLRNIDRTVEEAKKISQSFESKVNTIQTPRSANKQTGIDIGDSEEEEPNNDLFSPNDIQLNQWLIGSIGDSSDFDYFKIKTPQIYRDIIKVELQNQSTKTKPRIEIYYDNKERLGGTSEYSYKVTAGQNQSYSFSSEPNTVYYISVSFLDDNPGGYRLMVSPLRAYDDFEPNDDILNAKTISLKGTITANFTDRLDKDYYRIENASSDDLVTIRFENLSPDIKPRIGVYDNNKKWLGGTSQYSHKVTAGQNQSYSFPVEVNSVYYILVENLSDIPGPYRLTVDEE